ncbi:MAG: L-threonylcarbamoyladenylate synthase [Solirubrobacterales bacterium]|nr:L-threonylcarbamoyladenylate synthase [Solirubrobacterales bacterium]
MTAEDVEAFARCMAGAGVAVFPADTVYGLACEPDNAEAVRRLYVLKGRRRSKSAAVMFFDLDIALSALPELGPKTQAALGALLPGPVTVLVPNPATRFRLACGADPSKLGVRVPKFDGHLEPMRSLREPVLATSANLSGEPDARRLDDVTADIRIGADMLLDGGELPGLVSTVIDLDRFEQQGTWQIVRPGALSADAVSGALA